MTSYKVCELDGSLLDAAVAKSLGATLRQSRPWELRDSSYDGESRLIAVDPFDKALHDEIWQPSKNWAQAGPIIERERITIQRYHKGWAADVRAVWQTGDHMSRSEGEGDGESAIVAAMRAYVASKFGEMVDL